VLNNPVVTAPDAVAALDLEPTPDEISTLEDAYTPRPPTGF